MPRDTVLPLSTSALPFWLRHSVGESPRAFERGVLQGGRLPFNRHVAGLPRKAALAAVARGPVPRVRFYGESLLPER